jgi:uncharacterized membrane protein
MPRVGPCELLVVVFAGQETPHSAAAVLRAVDVSEGVRTLDALVVVKDGEGRVRGRDLTDPALSGARDGDRLGGADEAMINAEDVAGIGTLLTPHSSALALMIEHTWTFKPMQTVRDFGGALVAAVRVPGQ